MAVITECFLLELNPVPLLGRGCPGCSNLRGIMLHLGSCGPWKDLRCQQWGQRAKEGTGDRKGCPYSDFLRSPLFFLIFLYFGTVSHSVAKAGLELLAILLLRLPDCWDRDYR